MHFIFIEAYEFTHSFINVPMMSFHCNIHKFSLTSLNMASFKAWESSYTKGCKMRFSSTGENSRKSNMIFKKKCAALILIGFFSFLKYCMCELLLYMIVTHYFLHFKIILLISTLILILVRFKLWYNALIMWS